MTVIQIGLVDTTGDIDPHLVQQTAQALNVQVSRDLPQYWPIQATVIYLPDPDSLPVGVWPVQLVAQLPPEEGGFHLDNNNQPYAEVLAQPGQNGWTVAASHEVLEMLVDPFGNRLHAARAMAVQNGQIVEGEGEVQYLVEACDPCEADGYAYSVQGIGVSDFITPHFYDPVAVAGTRYSFTGALQAPRQILPGGYISWYDPETGGWQQLKYFDQGPVIVDLPPSSGNSLREWIHTQSPTEGLRRPRALSQGFTNRDLTASTERRRVHLDRAAERRAAWFRASREERGAH
jgi:hypothetical protein